VIKGVYRPDQKAQLAECLKCKYFHLMNKKTGVQEEIKSDVALIRCEGPLNNDRVRILEKVWELVKKSDKEHILLDISGVTNIYSCGIGLLMKMHKETEARNGVLVITGAQEFVATLLRNFHLESVFHFKDSAAEGMTIFNERIQKRLELQRLEEEAENARNALKKRMPCWEYWNNHNPANATTCDVCYRKITENSDPCWIVDGSIEGISFQYVCEDCLSCAYYLKFKDTIPEPGGENNPQGKNPEKSGAMVR
jgi:anti-anti-sigma factor